MSKNQLQKVRNLTAVVWSSQRNWTARRKAGQRNKMPEPHKKGKQNKQGALAVNSPSEILPKHKQSHCFQLLAVCGINAFPAQAWDLSSFTCRTCPTWWNQTKHWELTALPITKFWWRPIEISMGNKCSNVEAAPVGSYLGAKEKESKCIPSQFSFSAFLQLRESVSKMYFEARQSRKNSICHQ